MSPEVEKPNEINHSRVRFVASPTRNCPPATELPAARARAVAQRGRRRGRIPKRHVIRPHSVPVDLDSRQPRLDGGAGHLFNSHPTLGLARPAGPAFSLLGSLHAVDLPRSRARQRAGAPGARPELHLCVESPQPARLARPRRAPAAGALFPRQERALLGALHGLVSAPAGPHPHRAKRPQGHGS